MSTSELGLIAVVTPVFEDCDVAARLFLEIAKSLGRSIFIVAVEDGSRHHRLEASAISSAGLSGVVVHLKRNVGHQRAIAVGVCYVVERLAAIERVVVMDSDGEDTPASILDLFEPLKDSDVDCVVAQRKSRVETLRFRLFYVAYKGLFRLLSGRQISFGNFMAIKRETARRLAAMPELGVHVAASILLSRVRLVRVPIARGSRYSGSSKMNFVGLALHGFRGLMVFAEDVLVRVGIACSLAAALSVFGVAVTVMLKIFGHTPPGWASLVSGVLLLVVLQTGTLTLVILMLAGVMRSSAGRPLEWHDLIDRVEATDQHADASAH